MSRSGSFWAAGYGKVHARSEPKALQIHILSCRETCAGGEEQGRGFEVPRGGFRLSLAWGFRHGTLRLCRTDSFQTVASFNADIMRAEGLPNDFQTNGDDRKLLQRCSKQLGFESSGSDSAGLKTCGAQVSEHRSHRSLLPPPCFRSRGPLKMLNISGVAPA